MKYIVIEGNIGSGKSTLINHLKSKCDFLKEKSHATNFYISTEETGEWMNSGWLEKYYTNTKYAFGFQMKVLLSHIKQFNKFNKIAKENDVVILERCAYTTLYVFGKLLLEDGILDTLEYKLQKEYIEELINKPNLVIFIDTKPEESFVRMMKRSREGEQISLNYIKKVDTHYNSYINETLTSFENINIKTINGLLPEEEIIEECQNLIIDFLNK